MLQENQGHMIKHTNESAELAKPFKRIALDFLDISSTWPVIDTGIWVALARYTHLLEKLQAFRYPWCGATVLKP